MKKLSIKNLTLGCIACLASILLLIGIAFGGGFGFYFHTWYHVILSLFYILIDLAAIALVAVNVMFLLAGKTTPAFGVLTVTLSLAIVAAKFVMDLFCNSIAVRGFSFPAQDLIAFLLLLIPFIAYQLCKVYIPDDKQEDNNEE